jgi:DNA-binding IclR family transcriptional regulator
VHLHAGDAQPSADSDRGHEIRRLITEADVPEPAGGVDGLLADPEVSRERGHILSVAETIEDALSLAAPTPWLEQGLTAYSVTAPESCFTPRVAEAAARTLAKEMDRLHSLLRQQNPFS